MRAFICVFVIGFAAGAQAASYPDKPIRLIVPFPAGGGVDAVARVVGQRFSEIFGQQVVIDNRGGSSGIIAAEIAARAVADGYTLFFGVSASLAITPHLYRKLPYDPVRDFAPVSLIGEAPYFLSVHPSVAATTVKELIALAQSRPGQLNYASAGSGSTLHLTAELFKSMAGVNLVHVPYKGSAPALNDLLGGQVQVIFNPATLTLPHARTGRLRVLGVTTARRVAFAPEVPTIAEAGVPGYAATGWYGLLGPQGMPAPVVNKLYQTVAGMFADKAFGERFALLGVSPLAGNPAQFGAFIRAELVKWGRVVVESGARID
jgi:tripartite-type tricarboxylate transporter receptor subunit TctC